MLRLFFVELEDDEDPDVEKSMRVPANVEKVMASTCVVLLQLLFTGLFFRIVMSESDWLYTSSASLMAAFLAALFAWPLSRMCEKLFSCSRVKQQCHLRLATRSTPHGRSQNEIAHRGAALSCTLDLIDLLSLMHEWRQAIVEIKVSVRCILACGHAGKGSFFHPSHCFVQLPGDDCRVPCSHR